LLHCLFHTKVDPFFQIHDFLLTVQTRNQQLQPFADIERFQHFLLSRHFHGKMGSDHIRQPARLFDIRYRVVGFRADFLRALRIIFKMLQQQAHQGILFCVSFRFIRKRRYFHNRIIVRFFVVFHLSAFQTFNQHTNRAVRQFQHLLNVCQCTDFMKIVFYRLFDAHIFLSRQKDDIVFQQCLFQRRYGLFAADIYMQHHCRKYEKSSQR